MQKIIYLDNAATTWPKPTRVIKALAEFYNHFTGSQGRAGHGMALKASREVFETRELVAFLFNVPNSERVIFTANATHAINYALKGILKKGDHVICSGFEHNAVFRPLKYLESISYIELTILDCNKYSDFDLSAFEKSIKPNTKAVITTHGSNVNGSILPVREIGKICKEKAIIYIVDAAQTAGFIPIDLQLDYIDILAFSGHKKLYGPTGIGGLCFKNEIDIETLLHGGTGSRSESGEHPPFYPDKLEAGTPNTLGIYGLKAGIQHVMNTGISNIQKEQLELIIFFTKSLESIDEVIVYKPLSFDERLPLLSLNIKNMTSSDVSLILDKDFGIMTRAGLHCAPLAHKSIGTFPQGSVRFSFGLFNTSEEIEYTIESIKKIIKQR
ncbi:MAG: aminotransferase class V-fold PLP-dependent enzyme [Bacteroidales bacterium]|nr:aminotransferase class V-fold PLP-dependent enzyme [Bacteroidales bacterium]